MPVLVRCVIEAHEISMDEALVSLLSKSEVEARIERFVKSGFEENYDGEFDLGGSNYVHDEEIADAFSVKEITQEQYDAFISMFDDICVGASSGLLQSMLNDDA